MIFEGRIPEYPVGSIGGGGRYNNLIEQLSGQAIPAVGFGIGFDRTVEAVEALGLFSIDETQNTQVLVTVFDENMLEESLKSADQLRTAGVSTEVYPAFDKLGKQFKLADQKNIPFAIVIGESEQQAGMVMLKDMKSGEQKTVTLKQVIEQVL